MGSGFGEAFLESDLKIQVEKMMGQEGVMENLEDLGECRLEF